MMNQTSSVKVYETRNTTYQLGDQVEFKIPPSILAINPLESYFCCEVEVGSSEGAQLCLNKQIGAEALVREITIMNHSGSAVLEQITSYTKLKRVLSYYNHNSTDDNLNKLLQGGQDKAPILEDNKLFEKLNTGAVTQKKCSVMFKLSLSGIMNSPTPFPTMLTDGLIIKILLEDNIFNICERMGETQVGREPAIAKTNLRSAFQRCPGLNHTMCYQVSFFGNDATNPAVGGATDTALCINRRGAAAPTGGVSDNTSADLDADTKLNYQILESPTPTVVNCPFSTGMVVAILAKDNSAKVHLTITSVEINGAGADARWQLNFASTDLQSVSSGSVGAGITSRVALMDVGQTIPGTALAGQAAKPTLTISNFHLVCGIVNLSSSEISKLQSAANSKGGYNYDYQSYTHYGVNITKALVNSLYIPCKLNRTRSILSMYENVGSSIDGSRDNNLPVVDNDTLPDQYVYKINNLLVPNRPVSLSNYEKSPATAGRWGSVHLGELEKAIQEVGLSVKSLENPAQCLVVGRMLAILGHTFDMRSALGETRLEYNFSTQTRDLLFHNFVAHLRRLVITPTSTFVEM